MLFNFNFQRSDINKIQEKITEKSKKTNETNSDDSQVLSTIDVAGEKGEKSARLDNLQMPVTFSTKESFKKVNQMFGLLLLFYFSLYIVIIMYVYSLKIAQR